MSIKLEKLMEAQNVLESDREELRMFADVLQRRKDKRDGKDVGPLPEDMRAWLLVEVSK